MHPKQFQLAKTRQVSGVTRSTCTVHFSGGCGAEASEVPNRAWRPYLTSYRRGNRGDLPAGTHGTARHPSKHATSISLALAATKQESHPPTTWCLLLSLSVLLTIHRQWGWPFYNYYIKLYWVFQYYITIGVPILFLYTA
jgi:hypothetical protein